MKVTTKDLLKALPLEEKAKDKITQILQGQDKDRKFEVEQMIWDAYVILYQTKLQENLALTMEEAKKGKLRLDKNFHKSVKEKTDHEFKSYISGKSSQGDLTSVRDKLQNLMQERPN